MVEVFKTNLQNPQDAGGVITLLTRLLPGARITVDLNDCDKVLRIESERIDNAQVISMLELHGHLCEEMAG